jgi:hypothetical protein
MKRAPKSLWILVALLCFAGVLKATLPQVVIGTWTPAASLAQLADVFSRREQFRRSVACPEVEQVTGRACAVSLDVDDLTLARLNEATQAWVEQDYNRKRHSEINDTPLARFLAGPSVTRPCPDAAALRLAFTRTERRTLRKSDGTAVIEGRRFEVPNQYRHLSLLEVRFAAWDLTQVHLVDPHTGTVLCRLFPQDKAANASGLRRGMQPIAIETAKPSSPTSSSQPARGIGPLLARIDRPAGRHRTATRLPPQGRRRRGVNNKMLALSPKRTRRQRSAIPSCAATMPPRDVPAEAHCRHTCRGSR